MVNSFDTQQYHVEKVQAKNLLSALHAARERANATGGKIASLPDVIGMRFTEPHTSYIWQNSDIHTMTEEAFSLAVDDTPRSLVLHGVGLLAYVMDKPELREQFSASVVRPDYRTIEDAMQGKLPDGSEFPVIRYQEFVTLTSLPERYGILIEGELATKQFMPPKGAPKGLEMTSRSGLPHPVFQRAYYAQSVPRWNAWMGAKTEEFISPLGNTDYELIDHLECGPPAHGTLWMLRLNTDWEFPSRRMINNAPAPSTYGSFYVITPRQE